MGSPTVSWVQHTEMSRRALVATTVLASLLLAGRPAQATGPDPTLATVLSLASTLTPMAVTAGLWATGRGPEEGIRFDVGIGALAVGAIVGPSIGQFYAEAGTNAWVSLLLRSVTGSIMLTGVGFWARGAEEDAGLGQALTVVGGVPTTLLALYDIVDASSSAVEARRNRATASLPPPAVDIGGFSLCDALTGGCRGMTSALAHP